MLPSKKLKRLAVDRRHLDHHKTASTERSTEFDGIPSLNDDCLLAIFSFVSIMDLFELRKCSRRFRALADMAAPKKCRNEQFHYIRKHEIHEEVLKCYGEFMQNVVVEHSIEIEQLIYAKSVACLPRYTWLKYLPALKTLKLRGMKVECHPGSAQIYGNLENLEFDHCRISRPEYEQIFDECRKLKTFCTFSDGSYWNFDLLAKLENIEKISLRGDDMHLTERFIAELAKLKKLEKLNRLELELYCFEDFARIIPIALNQHNNIKSCQMKLKLFRGIGLDSLGHQDFRAAMAAYDVSIISKNGPGPNYITCDITIQKKN